MPDIEKTIFISYRRSLSSYIARAVFQDLRDHGYDVFMDVESINSGTFDTIILNQIAARAHFLVILTPGTLDRCAEAGDWLRREIERAIELDRNIVPIMASDFAFKDAEKFLTGGIQKLSRFNGIVLHHDYFDEAMDRLRERFLSQPVAVEVTAPPAQEEHLVRQRVAATLQVPLPTQQQLSAEDHFSLGYRKYGSGDYQEALQELDAALAINPDYAFAYTIRGVVRTILVDPEGAIADFDQALRLDPGDSRAYGNRGNAYYGLGDYSQAIADYDQALQIDPQYDRALYNRGLAYQHTGIRSKAVSDFHTLLGFSKDASLCQEARDRLSELGEAPQAPRAGYLPGERVFAFWELDEYWYPAVVREVEDQRLYIRFDDGTKQWKKREEVLKMDLEVGEAVTGRYKGKEYYYPAHVLQIDGEAIQVEYDYTPESPDDPSPHEQESTTLSMIRVTR